MKKSPKKQFSDPFEFDVEFTVFDVQHCVTAVVAVADGTGIKQCDAVIFGKMLIMCVSEKSDIRACFLCLIRKGPEVFLVFHIGKMAMRSKYDNAFYVTAIPKMITPSTLKMSSFFRSDLKSQLPLTA